jgi:hypothetical protein
MVTMAHGLDRLIERAEMPTASATDGLERESASFPRMLCISMPARFATIALPQKQGESLPTQTTRNLDEESTNH